MRVAVLHSFYRGSAPSGENQAVLDQMELLSQAGHEVCLISRETDTEIVKFGYKLRASIRVATGWGGDPTKELRAFNPDVVHIHNLFPNFGTTWLEEWPGPIVATMHNYRAVCSNGYLYRNGDICFDCTKGSPWSGIRHACYQDSVSATIPVALSISRNGRMNRILSRVNVVLCLSQTAADIFAAAGVRRERLVVLPNPLQDPQEPLQQEGRGWLYSGRLTDEKGVLQLVRNWPQEAEPLDVVGHGPLLSHIEAIRSANIRVIGRLERNELLRRIPSYRGLVVPSRWIEVQPTVLTEALACGVPVVAFAKNAAAVTVRNLRVGAVYDSPLGIPDALDEIEAGGLSLRRRSRRIYESHFGTGSWVAGISELFKSLI